MLLVSDGNEWNCSTALSFLQLYSKFGPVIAGLVYLVVADKCMHDNESFSTSNFHSHVQAVHLPKCHLKIESQDKKCALDAYERHSIGWNLFKGWFLLSITILPFYSPLVNQFNVIVPCSMAIEKPWLENSWADRSRLNRWFIRICSIDYQIIMP